MDMDELLNMIVTDESPSQISDAIKDMLYAKSSERVEASKPEVASSVFGQEEDQEEDSVESEVDSEEEE